MAALSSPMDPIVYNALRYTVNTTEYTALHQRSPQSLRKRAVDPEAYTKATRSRDDYHAATTRAVVRVFLTTQAGLKLWDLVQDRVLTRGKAKP